MDSDSIKPRQVSNRGEICVYTVQDKDRCWITGMALLSPDCLIATDAYNYSIKMADTKTNSIITQLSLDTKPWEVTTTGRHEVAVTLPDKQTVQFVSASADTLTKKHTLNVDGNCYGISCNQKKLVVTFENPEMVQILNMNGIALTTINTDENGEAIFHGPEHVITNSSSIYVSDTSKSTVYRLNWQGEVIGSYEGVSNPSGVALSEDGSVFVCDISNNNMLEISGDCSKKAVVLQDLGPMAVCWCAAEQTLYISSWSSDENFNRVLQIFKLS